MGKHYLVRVEIDAWFETPEEAAQDTAYWLYHEGGAKRAVYEVIDQATEKSVMVDLEEIGYNYYDS